MADTSRENVHNISFVWISNADFSLLWNIYLLPTVAVEREWAVLHSNIVFLSFPKENVTDKKWTATFHKSLVTDPYLQLHIGPACKSGVFTEAIGMLLTWPLQESHEHPPLSCDHRWVFLRHYGVRSAILTQTVPF